MTISGDDFSDRRRRGTTTEREEAPAPRHSERELVTQGYVRRAHYDYTAIDHTGLYAVRRYQHPNIPNHKEIRQGREDGHSEWLKPYDGVRVPFRWPELHAADQAQYVYWTEGEKDAETLARLGLVATTAAGQKLSATIVKALRGFRVVVLVDNDDKGEDNARKAVDAFRHYAASVRVVRLPRLQRSEDVTDWLDLRDGTLEELKQIVEEAPVVRSSETLDEDAGHFVPQAHSTIKRREWLYKPAYIRTHVSFTAGAGARGKSTLTVSEALAMVSGKPLLGVQPPGQLRVWYVNLEDDMEELKRRFNASMAEHELTPADIGDRLYVESGVGREVAVAVEDFKQGAALNRALLDKIARIIRKRRIDVVIFDPFVSMHRVPENDNGAMDLVVKALKNVAQETNCSIMLVHHTRKPKGDEGGVDDLRGAVSQINAARYVRLLLPMSKDEATAMGVDQSKRGFYFRSVDGKQNLTPPVEQSEWYRLQSFELGNAGECFEDEGDHVGVATRFVVAAEPNALANVTMEQVRACFGVGGPWRFDRQARSGWAGDALADALGVGAETKPEKDALQRALRGIVQRGWLTKYTAPDRYRMPREFVKLPETATPSEGDAQNEGDAL